MKDSPGGSSVGKSSAGSSGLGGPQGETGPSVKDEKPEVELSNLVMCSRLSHSQSSLKSSSSIGSVRGDEGGLYADFYGDYCPLFDNGQESDSASLRGKTVHGRCAVSNTDFSSRSLSLITAAAEKCWLIQHMISVLLLLLLTLGFRQELLFLTV